MPILMWGGGGGRLKTGIHIAAPADPVTRAGLTAMLMEQYLVRDGFSFEHTREALATNHRVTLEAGDGIARARRLETTNRSKKR